VQVEGRGIEAIPAAERHGRSSSLFTLWFAANLGVPPWFTGVLALTLGLSVPWALLGVLVGNLIGAVLVGLASAMGPRSGLPQLMLSRDSFGRRGVYLPAVLNWLSCLGWFAVNSVLGGELTASLLHIPAVFGLCVIAAVQIVIAVFGYDMVHRAERWVSVLLLLTFAFFTVRAAIAGAPIRLTSTFSGAGFALTVAMTASYLFSWAPYASDYSRYLPSGTSPAGVFGWTFLGGFLSCLWVEVLGVLLAARFHLFAAVPLLQAAAGGLGVFVFAAGILGTLTANLLNIYTGATSLLALDVRVPRWLAAVTVGVLGTVLAAFGMRGFSGDYEAFLLLLSYWVAPWLGVMLAQGGGGSSERSVERGMWAFLIGFLASVPFMSQSLFTGPAARAMGGADLAYYVGGLAAAIAFLLLRRAVPGRPGPAAQH